MINLKFAFQKKTRDIQKKIASKMDQVLDQLNNSFQKVFGKETSLKDWRDNPRQTERRLREDIVTDISNLKPTQANRLKYLYKKAWQKRYSQIISDYKAASPNYNQGAWRKYKQKGLRRLRPAHWVNRKIYYTTHGLTTGYLRDSITSGFQAGGNKHLNVANLLLQGGFALDLSSYRSGSSDKKDHYTEFINQLVKAGVLSQPEDFMRFEARDWQRIGSYIKSVIGQEFVTDFKKIVENIKVDS